MGCQVALAVRWPGRVPGGRVVEDFVSLQDLAPTFLEAGGETPPDCMTAASLTGVLESGESGQVDPERTFVVIGRERHVGDAREGNLPYPQRSIRTREYLYIRNFEPDRWPMGDPKGLDDPTTAAPDYEDLCWETRICYADLDASPTKAWMIHHRAEELVQPLYELGFGKFPAEELYDVRSDPHQMRNLIGHPEHAGAHEALSKRLTEVLREQEDPRVTEAACRFERSPFTDLPER
jgi:arylsulfatase A-like enzyme